MSEPKFKHLLEPLKIGNYVLKNRMCVQLLALSTGGHFISEAPAIKFQTALSLFALERQRH